MQRLVGVGLSMFRPCLFAFAKMLPEIRSPYRRRDVGFGCVSLHYGQYRESGRIVLNGSLEKFGDIYVGALAILQSAMQLVSVPLTGFAQGFVPVASYNYGHGDRQRVKDCFRIVLTVMFSFNFVLMLLMICFPTVVASAFTSDPELIATVEHVLPLFLAGMTIFGLQRACQNMFVALGQARISIL